ncbi:hypothetical protein M9H77_12351 [Catharanthus roseus]|uniref:Uncharacterized protein n=1 Tax=Catharanthus roseus TaxID=4058 RepID=A0ACC0BH84_CATRO|nr:hypothetical protein M9H77_12351 [Catharanthus roseus]
MTEELKPEVTKPVNGSRATAMPRRDAEGKQKDDQVLKPSGKGLSRDGITGNLLLSLSLSLSLFFPHNSLSNLTNRQSKVTVKIGEQQSRIECRNRERKSSGGAAKIRRKSKSLEDSKRQKMERRFRRGEEETV